MWTSLIELLRGLGTGIAIWWAKRNGKQEAISDTNLDTARKERDDAREALKTLDDINRTPIGDLHDELRRKE